MQFSCRPTFHWTDQKLRVHAFYCVLALLLLNLLRRKLAKAGIPLTRKIHVFGDTKAPSW